MNNFKVGDLVVWNIQDRDSFKWLKSVYGKGPFKITKVENGRIQIEDITTFYLRSDCFKLYRKEQPSPTPILKNHCNLL